MLSDATPIAKAVIGPCSNGKVYTPADRLPINLRSMLGGLERLPFPTIAAIDRPALGGSLEMVLSCDLRVPGQSLMTAVVSSRTLILESRFFCHGDPVNRNETRDHPGSWRNSAPHMSRWRIKSQRLHFHCTSLDGSSNPQLWSVLNPHLEPRPPSPRLLTTGTGRAEP